MSSHREAPEISKDPVADSADVYAFVSPDAPSMVTLIANYVPLQLPDGGPNFFEFGNDVLYAINVDNNGDGVVDIAYEFRFTAVNTIPSSFLYNDGPIHSLTDPNWNRRQTYSVTRATYAQPHAIPKRTVLGSNLACPPCNIGPLSTPDYSSLAHAAIHELADGCKVFAGQRAEGFYVDLGAVFDLGDLRPFEEAHATFGIKNTGFTNGALGINSTDTINVHSIALQIPISDLVTKAPSGSTDPAAILGVWTTASRSKVQILEEERDPLQSGPQVQVSRLGNPLINEVLIPISRKDYWNRQLPSEDSQFLADYTNPLLAQLLPLLYSKDGKGTDTVFPNLLAYNNGKPNRADLVAILLTGIPPGVVAPTYSTFSGTGVKSDLLRLNVAIPPAAKPNNLGVLGGDVAGFPNGRRVFDDVATIELRCVAGATLGLVDKSFTPDAAAGPPGATGGFVNFGLTNNGSDLAAKMTEHYLNVFPYLGVPHSGFNAHTAQALAG